MNTSALSAQIRAYSEKNCLISNDARIIIGLSGGPDSVLLTHFLASLRETLSIDLIAAHLDHGWRPESAHDAQFCAALCAQLAIPFVSSTIPELNLRIVDKGSKEAYARNARRFFLERVRSDYISKYSNQYSSEYRNKHREHIIALGHHAQDQQETFFIRLVRGAGTAGLAAMYPKKDAYIRPLLETNKSDIISFLTQHRIPFLTDPTNISFDFLRNRIRHLVIPALHTADPRFDHNFQRTIHNLQTTEHFLTEITQTLFNQITTHAHGKILLNTTLFKQQHELMQHRILMHLLITAQVPFTPTQHFLQEIIRFITQPSTTKDTIKTHRINPSWQLVKKLVHGNVFVFIEKQIEKHI